jgi:biopolymer transport protein ExbD/biopolymer transport protein TolR
MGTRKALFNEINITPLTDIFLVLLIIMMVVAPMLDTTGLKVAVPSIGPSAETKTEPKTTQLMISASGEYTIQGERISGITLVSKLQLLKATAPDGVIIKTNPNASHSALTLAMDAAQSAGITKVAVVASESATP